MTDLGFTIEKRAGTDVVVYDDGSCHPATPDEVALWQALTAEREAFARYRDAAEQAAREDATRALVLQGSAGAQRDRAIANADTLHAVLDAARALADRWEHLTEGPDETWTDDAHELGTSAWHAPVFAAQLRAALDEHLGGNQ